MHLPSSLLVAMFSVGGVVALSASITLRLGEIAYYMHQVPEVRGDLAPTQLSFFGNQVIEYLSSRSSPEMLSVATKLQLPALYSQSTMRRP